MKRVRLGNTVFEGLNNVYVLDGDRTALVDTGVAVPDVRAELRDGLAEFDLELADVDDVFVTHWHPDHAGLAGEVQAESGATVHVHEADAGLVAGEETPFLEDDARRRETFDDWGMPAEARADLRAYLDGHADLAGDGADVTPFTDGTTFAVGGLTLEAVHLPGHAAGLSAFAFAGDAEAVRDGPGPEEAFVGDALLPKYTPNVGGADVRVESALSAYADSLVRVIERGWARAWPGHRDPIDDPAGRAAAILEHHRERTRRVVDVLAERGPCDAWTVSAHLFGDLSEIHILHGPGEAYAHLDHLHEAGAVTKDDRGYALVDPDVDVDVDALFPAPTAVEG